MKKFKISTLAILLLCALLSVIFTSCESAGVTSQKLNGDEQELPVELKGLKIYSVSTGNGTYVKVAVLDDKINSTTYSVGKFQESTLIVNKRDSKIIPVSQILVENDSLIVCKK